MNVVTVLKNIRYKLNTLTEIYFGLKNIVATPAVSKVNWS